MTLAALLRALAWPYFAFAKWFTPNKERLSLGDHLAGGFVFLFLALISLSILLTVVYGAWQEVQFGMLSSAGHLAKAKEVCGATPHCSDPQSAIHNLQAIPSTSAQYSEATKLSAQISAQIKEDEGNRNRGAYEQMVRNFSGESHDTFQCSQSKDNDAILSFDDGQTWWKDDGRCAERLQQKRDEDAQISSYWPTTLRVDTDMNSSWLPDEERVCQTFPDSKGKVSAVRCSISSGSPAHNIPVEFWGGVNRNTVSDWKCTREESIFEDRFVCRATD